MCVYSADAGGIEWLVESMCTSDATDSLKKHAAAALGTLVFGHHGNMRRVLDAGGVDALTNATRTDDHKAQQNALWALSVIGNHPQQSGQVQALEPQTPPPNKPLASPSVSPFKRSRDAWDQRREKVAQQNLIKSRNGRVPDKHRYDHASGVGAFTVN